MRFIKPKPGFSPREGKFIFANRFGHLYWNGSYCDIEIQFGGLFYICLFCERGYYKRRGSIIEFHKAYNKYRLWR